MNDIVEPNETSTSIGMDPASEMEVEGKVY